MANHTSSIIWCYCCVQFVNMHNLQNALHHFEIMHAQFANFWPKPDPKLTQTLMLTPAKLRSIICKLHRFTKYMQLVFTRVPNYTAWWHRQVWTTWPMLSGSSSLTKSWSDNLLIMSSTPYSCISHNTSFRMVSVGNTYALKHQGRRG